MKKTSSGYSLVEIMVAMVISLVLVGGLVSTFTSTNKTYSELTKTSQQIENGRFAVQLLQDDIQHAGFLGEYTDAPPIAGSAPDPCVVSADEFQTTTGATIYGFDGAATSPLSCTNASFIADNYRPDTDILVIRRAATEPVTTALEATKYYVQGLGSDVLIQLGGSAFNLEYNTLDLTSTTPPPIFPFVEHIYFVADCSRCTGTTTDTIPTLHRAELVGGTLTDFALVEGIENIQFRYGVDSGTVAAPTTYRSVNGSGTALTLGEWNNVVAVEINLLARNTQSTPGYLDTKTYKLDPDAPVIAGGNTEFKRHVFSGTVRTTNMASRKEWGLL